MLTGVVLLGGPGWPSISGSREPGSLSTGQLLGVSAGRHLGCGCCGGHHPSWSFRYRDVCPVGCLFSRSLGRPGDGHCAPSGCCSSWWWFGVPFQIIHPITQGNFRFCLGR